MGKLLLVLGRASFSKLILSLICLIGYLGMAEQADNDCTDCSPQEIWLWNNGTYSFRRTSNLQNSNCFAGVKEHLVKERVSQSLLQSHQHQLALV
jgi:hypothetical protein